MDIHTHTEVLVNCGNCKFYHRMSPIVGRCKAPIPFWARVSLRGGMVAVTDGEQCDCFQAISTVVPKHGEDRED